MDNFAIKDIVLAKNKVWWWFSDGVGLHDIPQS